MSDDVERSELIAAAPRSELAERVRRVETWAQQLTAFLDSEGQFVPEGLTPLVWLWVAALEARRELE